MKQSSSRSLTTEDCDEKSPKFYIEFLHLVQRLTAVSVIGHRDNTHRLLRNISTQDLHICPGVFLSPEHSPPHPVGPKDVVSIHRQAKWMDRFILQHDLQGEAKPQS